MGSTALDLLPVEKLALVFPSNIGRPTKELYTVLGTLALQQYHDLTDQQTSEQLSYNIQWHYALDLVDESDEAKYICPKTLWNMRTLATELRVETDLFGATAEKLAAMFDVDTSHQRIDSVHIRSNMARLSRIGIFAKAIIRFTSNLRRHHPALWELIDSNLIDRYKGKKAKECFAGVRPSQSKKTLAEVASDLYRLVIQFEGSAEVADMSTYKLLCRILKEQCDVGSDGTVEVKAPENISSDSLQNPSDPDATYSGHKGQGYQVQIMETFCEHEGEQKDSTQLNLITHVQVEKACQSDAGALLPAIEETLERDLAPEELQADSLYGSDENVQQAEQLGVKVISPTMGTEKPGPCNLSDFTFLSNGHVDRCPAGQLPALRKRKKERFSQGFELERCAQCPLAESCPGKTGGKFFYVRYTEKNMRIAKRRQFERSEAFMEKYRWRAGAEATMSQVDRLTGIKRLRVRGMKAVRFAAVMKAIAVNLARAVAAKRARDRAQGFYLDQSWGASRVILLFKERVIRFWGSISSLVREKCTSPVIAQKAA
ncbi:MAG: transposase [Desulfobacterales bacterium]|nr:transposase [Desulfobacterales bacterium]